MARDPLAALEQVDRTDGDGVYVLKDFHECWANAQIKRKLRGVAQRLKFTKKSILVTTPTTKLHVAACFRNKFRLSRQPASRLLGADGCRLVRLILADLR